jgi:SAM-dependent methyltransferase
VQIVRERLRRLGVADVEGRVVQGSALEIPHADAAFGHVVTIGCLHHTGDLARAIAEVHRVLRPGGTAMVMLYNHHSFRRLGLRWKALVERARTDRLTTDRHEREAYDFNAAGEAAPETVFVTARQVRQELFAGFSDVRIERHNFNPVVLGYVRGRTLMLSRERALPTIARVLRPGEKPDCRWRERAERERMLTRVAQDAERALRAVEEADGLLGDERVADAHRLLHDLVGQDFDIDDDGVPRLHRGTRADRIVSVIDPEMRHGRESESQRFDGFKLSAAATNSAQPLISAIDVAPACEQDGTRVGVLVDLQPEHRRPTRPWRHGRRRRGDARRDDRARHRGARPGARTAAPPGLPRQARLRHRP